MPEIKVKVPVAKVTTWANIRPGDVVALDKKVYRVHEIVPCGYASVRATVIGPDGEGWSIVKREKTQAMVVG